MDETMVSDGTIASIDDARLALAAVQSDGRTNEHTAAASALSSITYAAQDKNPMSCMRHIMDAASKLCDLSPHMSSRLYRDEMPESLSDACKAVVVALAVVRKKLAEDIDNIDKLLLS